MRIDEKFFNRSFGREICNNFLVNKNYLKDFAENILWLDKMPENLKDKKGKIEDIIYKEAADKLGNEISIMAAFALNESKIMG